MRVNWFQYVAVLACACTLPCSATPVSPTDLFLSPTLVPEALYDTHSLSFGTSTDVFEHYTSALVGGTLLGVRILPVLNPNPASPDGSYSAADFAAINAGNFSSFFFREPGTAYTADFTPSDVTVDYKASGQYMVQITAQNAGGTFSKIFNDQVDDPFAEDPPIAGKDKSGPSRKIATPTADLVLVSDGDPNDNGALVNAFKIFSDAGANVQKVNSLAAVKKAIQDAFAANGNKKISVVLVGHGRGLPKGSIKIGTERINNDVDSTMTPAAFQAMIDKFVSSIEFDSCNTGQDLAFLQTFANSIGKASGYPTTVTFAAPSFFGLFSGYVDVGAGGKKAIDEVPEPATFVLLAAGLASVRYARRRKPLLR